MAFEVFVLVREKSNPLQCNTCSYSVWFHLVSWLPCFPWQECFSLVSCRFIGVSCWEVLLMMSHWTKMETQIRRWRKVSTAKESALFITYLGAFKELNCQVLRNGASFTVLGILNKNKCIVEKETILSVTLLCVRYGKYTS